jgi:RNA polymerase sigma-70 factor (ECF subfamily)
MNQETDLILYNRIKDHDSQALEALYDRYEKLLYSFAYKQTQNTTLAEEVVQDVFLKLWEEKAVYDESKGRFSSWLLTITRYTAIDRLRKEKPVTSYSLEERDSLKSNDPTTEEAYLWKQEREQLLQKMTALSRDQQEVIDLFYFKGLTHAKIAEVCNLPLGTVKGRIRIALKHLKEGLLMKGGYSNDS